MTLSRALLAVLAVFDCLCSISHAGFLHPQLVQHGNSLCSGRENSISHESNYLLSEQRQQIHHLTTTAALLPRRFSTTAIKIATSELFNENEVKKDETGVKDIISVTTHLLACFGAAVLFCSYENYDCSSLKPSSSTLRPMAVEGLGYGKHDRMEDWRGEHYQVVPQTSSSSNSVMPVEKIPSTNEILERHRAERVPRWRKNASLNTNVDGTSRASIGVGTVTPQQVKDATGSIYMALEAIDSLKVMADDYQWDNMRDLLRQSVLSSKIDEACSMLRGAVGYISTEGRAEIGFDWGSCAWRHCGAEADAQEALAEFYNLLGVLEPFECRFMLDIVERSLRDVLTVVPTKFHDGNTIHSYIPYEPVGQANDPNGESGEMGLDVEFLKTLQFLKGIHD